MADSTQRDGPSLQVAAFAATSMGAEAVLSQQLPGGTSQQHSEELLLQTAEAQGAGLRCVASVALRSLLCSNRLVYMHRCWQAQWLTNRSADDSCDVQL